MCCLTPKNYFVANKAQNLGLGVLKMKDADAESSESESESDDEDGDDAPKEKDILGKLMGQERKKEAVAIQEVQDKPGS
jgi:hypothetical protein